MSISSAVRDGRTDLLTRLRRGFWGRLLRKRLAWFGLLIMVMFVGATLTADIIAPYEPARQDYGSVLLPPGKGHLMGTDNFGRDVCSRVIHGSRVSLTVGLLAVGLALVTGAIIGLISGYYLGWVDEVLMRIMDALYSFPALLLALAITVVLGPGLTSVIIAIGIVYTPVFARVVRSRVLSVREQDYVSAAVALGISTPRLIFRHILPNVAAPLIVQASLNVSSAIIAEASLSFLGIGVQPPTPSWGTMLKTGYAYMEIAPWLAVFPGIAIFLTVLGMNVFGDALRDVLDPKMRGQG
jgi:peptide/nickel transport system permease protein